MKKLSNGIKRWKNVTETQCSKSVVVFLSSGFLLKSGFLVCRARGYNYKQILSVVSTTIVSQKKPYSIS